MLPSFVPQTADNRRVTKFSLMVFNTNSYFYIVHIYLLPKLHLTLFYIYSRLLITRTMFKARDKSEKKYHVLKSRTLNLFQSNRVNSFVFTVLSLQFSISLKGSSYRESDCILHCHLKTALRNFESICSQFLSSFLKKRKSGKELVFALMTFVKLCWKFLSFVLKPSSLSSFF